MKSREEIRFLALLSKTQEKAAKLKNNQASKFNSEINCDDAEISNIDLTEDDDWRLPKFVETLNDWLVSLERHPQGPTKEILVEYRAKVDFLMKILETRANTSNATNVKKSVDVVDVAGGTRRRSVRSSSPPNITEVIRPIPVLPHGPAATSETITKEIHQKTMERHNEQIRAELFGSHLSSADETGTGNLRKRNIPEESNDLDYLLKAHHQAQEQVAEEMLSLTKSLKEQSLAAKEVIEKDTTVIDKTNTVADKNAERLKKEADRLQEHTKSSCRCWIWLLCVIVMVTFISMVWVMKFFRKRSDY